MYKYEFTVVSAKMLIQSVGKSNSVISIFIK